MKVIATAPGFYGSYREVGDKFEVPDGAVASWFEPVEAPKAARNKKTEQPNVADDLT